MLGSFSVLYALIHKVIFSFTYENQKIYWTLMVYPECHLLTKNSTQGHLASFMLSIPLSYAEMEKHFPHLDCCFHCWILRESRNGTIISLLEFWTSYENQKLRQKCILNVYNQKRPPRRLGSPGADTETEFEFEMYTEVEEAGLSRSQNHAVMQTQKSLGQPSRKLGSEHSPENGAPEAWNAWAFNLLLAHSPNVAALGRAWLRAKHLALWTWGRL